YRLVGAFTIFASCQSLQPYRAVSERTYLPRGRSAAVGFASNGDWHGLPRRGRPAAGRGNARIIDPTSTNRPAL
ncbi:MAG TPA: hypothetical protein VG944_23770, partial [Fimbriimonas sp.]|nr:hypothetical protein [Fimbriimonas sp.]